MKKELKIDPDTNDLILQIHLNEIEQTDNQHTGSENK